MNKVMTRTKRHPGTRPPGRQDTRRPGTTPPRSPGSGTPRRTPDNSPPSTPPGSGTSRPIPTTPTTPPSTLPRTASTGALPATAATRKPPRPTPNGDGGPPGATMQPPGGGAPPRPTDLFADRLLAVLSGQRPVHCMLRHTAGRAYDELAWLAERGPLRTRGTRPVVRDVGYYVARRGAIEAFARIGAGDQLRAMAFRLERGPDLRWRCTAVELGGPRMHRTDAD
ncbi:MULTISPECIES: Rv3235 family protein [Streptomyces]|uniref:Uncharacterized protein n=1 Tax=Streptomyces dengpaensis TaxID=2049881 RepID=A0ABM6SUL6_9ACTN|nr:MULTISPECIES: Rv3235 family protein [Streptomyces]AVH58365.1 hypothetical protein C4B68_24280 [Streptomyces dengpaensis]PIB06041.1 hypothetical protein B1C81_26010 [Streptomyces sp. HG99]